MKLSRRQLLTGLIVSSTALYLLDRRINWTGIQTGTVQDIFDRVDQQFTGALAKAFEADPAGSPPPEEVLQDIVGVPVPARLDELVEQIRARVEDDYKAFRIINVEGWEMSRTECALGYYLESRRVESNPNSK